MKLVKLCNIFLLFLFLLPRGSQAITTACSGFNFTCYLLEAGNVTCIGDNSLSQLGRSVSNSTIPPTTLPPFPTNITSITCGQSHVIVIQSGFVKSWGNSNRGQTGTGSTTTVATPTQINSVTANPSSIVAGIDFTCINEISQFVQCFGNNAVGQLGLGTTTNGLVPGNSVPQPCTWQQLSAGGSHVIAKCVLTGVFAWGLNNFGQLGDGTVINKGSNAADFPLTALPVLSTDVIQVSAGLYHSCLLLVNGTVACTGQGFGLTLVLNSMYNFTSIQSYQNTTCATTTVPASGTVVCFTGNVSLPFPYFNPYTLISLVPGLTSSQICGLVIDSSYSTTVKRLVCVNSVTFAVTMINPTCGDNIVQAVEGEECDPPGTTCSPSCKIVIPGTPAPTTPSPSPTPTPSPTPQIITTAAVTSLLQVTPSPTTSPIVNTLIPQTIVNNTSILTPVTIVGNFSVADTATLTISNATLIDVKGCANLAGNLTVITVNETNPFLKADCITGGFNQVSLPANPDCGQGKVTVNNDGDRFAAFVQSDCPVTVGIFPFWVIGVVVGFVVLMIVVVVSFGFYKYHSYSRYGIVFHKMTDDGSL